MDYYEVSQKAISHMPPPVSFRPDDSEIIRAHADLIRPHIDEFVQGFYDTLFGYETTKAVFKEGEREAREQTLRKFFERVLSGPHDDEFFTWLGFVGPVHVVRQVSNPMMLSMLGYMVVFVMKTVQGNENAGVVTEAFVRLAATLGAIISYGYEVAWQEALENVVGMPPELVRRMVHEEAQRMFPLRGESAS